MAEISYPGYGKAPVVLLNGQDHQLLSDALTLKQSQGFTGKQLSELSGVNRTYFYNLVSANQVDLMRFAIIQKVLDIRLLNRDQIEDHLDVIRKLLTE